MTFEPATYPGYRFPAEAIRHTIWLCNLFGLNRVPRLAAEERLCRRSGQT